MPEYHGDLFAAQANARAVLDARRQAQLDAFRRVYDEYLDHYAMQAGYMRPAPVNIKPEYLEPTASAEDEDC